MSRLWKRRPSPAMVVAVIALIAALAGTAYAAQKINGNLIEKQTIGAGKLKKKTLTGFQINTAKLGTVPFAKVSTHTFGVVDDHPEGVRGDLRERHRAELRRVDLEPGQGLLLQLAGADRLLLDQVAVDLLRRVRRACEGGDQGDHRDHHRRRGAPLPKPAHLDSLRLDSGEPVAPPLPPFNPEGRKRSARRRRCRSRRGRGRGGSAK